MPEGVVRRWPAMLLRGFVLGASGVAGATTMAVAMVTVVQVIEWMGPDPSTEYGAFGDWMMVSGLYGIAAVVGASIVQVSVLWTLLFVHRGDARRLRLGRAAGVNALATGAVGAATARLMFMGDPLFVPGAVVIVVLLAAGFGIGLLLRWSPRDRFG